MVGLTEATSNMKHQMKVKETKRVVKQENLGKCFISTVRLHKAYAFPNEQGVDEYPLGKFETMITVEESWIDYQKRCDTLDEAKIQHQEAILYVMKKYGVDGNGV